MFQILKHNKGEMLYVKKKISIAFVVKLVAHLAAEIIKHTFNLDLVDGA